MSKKYKLLPCPFCGNATNIAVANEDERFLTGGYFIACPACHASTGLRYACGEDPRPLLVEQWNRRTPGDDAQATERQDWRIAAANWLRMKAEEQRATNAQYPRHAEAYPSWLNRADDRMRLAEELEMLASAFPYGLDAGDSSQTASQVPPAE